MQSIPSQSPVDTNVAPRHYTRIQKRMALLTLCLILFTHIMDFMVLMPLGPQFMRLFEINPQQFSFMVSVYSLSAGIFGFLGSFIFDRVNRKSALFISYIGFLLGTLACALSPSYSFLLIARALSGAFGGVLNAIAFAIVGDIFHIQERGQATGKLMASFSLAAVVGVPFGLMIAQSWGWHAPFFAIVYAGLLILIMLLKWIPSIKPAISKNPTHIFSGITENLKDKNSLIALVTTFSMIFSQFVVIPLISSYLVSNTGYPEDKLPFVYLLGGGLTAFTGPLMGRLCDRFGARYVFTRSGLLFLLPAFLITHLGVSPMSISLSVTTLYFVLSNARMIPAMTLISSSIPQERRGSFMSLNSSLQQLASAAASGIGGWFVTQDLMGGPMIGFSHTAYIAVLFGIIAYFFGQKVKMVS